MGGAQGSSLIRNREAGTCSYQMVLAFAGHMRITASHFWVPEPERREEEQVVQRAYSPTGRGMR